MKIKTENVPAPAEEVKTPEIVETERELAKVEEGVSQLARVLRQRYTPEKVADLLAEMCEAEDVKMSKDGQPYTTKNWDARVKGWDRLTNMLGYTKKDASPTEASATKIVFNIVQNSGEVGGKPAA